jgi:MFS superfamily sulfate permease-like transporter
MPADSPTVRPAEPAATSGAPVKSAMATLLAEVRGGTIAAAVAIPLGIAFGMFAFVGLGDEFFGNGVVAGLAAALIAGLVCVLLGDRSGAFFAPRIVTTFFIGTLLLQHVANSDATIVREGGPSTVLAIVFAIVLVAGMIQLLFGALRVGTLIRFTPQPVIAGFQDCAALLLVLAQVGQIMGLDTHVSFGRVFDHLHDTKPLSVLVAACSGLAMWHARHWVKRMPPILFGLLVGTVAYYALVGLGLRDALGPAIGAVPAVQLIPENGAAFLALIDHPGFGELLPVIFTGALSIAIIASVDALVCSRLLSAAGARVPANVQLARLGTANIAVACFGGITAGFNLGSTSVNRAFGGAGVVSMLVGAIVTLLLIVAAMPIVAYLPRAVLSGVVVIIGIQHLDPWSVKVIRQVFSWRRTQTRRPHFDATVIIAVAMAAIFIDIVFAVFLGVALAIMSFLMRMSRTIVRRVYRANNARSRKTREPNERQFLGARGAVILVVELDGALFFGTAEQLTECIERELGEETRWVLLDCKRVAEVDSTGAGIVAQMRSTLARQGIKLGICSVAPDSAAGRALWDYGVFAGTDAAHGFVDIDRGIERAEDELIDSELTTAPRPGDFPLGALTLTRRMDLTELAFVRSRLTRRRYVENQVVFKQGDPGDALFIIMKGTASARMIEGGKELRLMTFAPGTVFGEMGLLERSSRSATVMADTVLECLVLDAKSLDALGDEHPGVAIKMLAGLGRELASRLRSVNRTIVHLET